MIEREKRWVASCGGDCESRVGKLERPSTGRTRNLRVFFLFAFSLVDRAQRASEGQRSTGTQERRGQKRKTQRPKCSNSERKINGKSVENRRKSSPNRPKIDEKSILGHFGRPRLFRGRVRTRSGRLWDVQMPPQGRSWDAPGGPRAARSRPKASPGRRGDAPRPSR